MSQLELGLHGITLVPQATGYGLLIGLGVAFYAVILGAIKVQKAYLSEDSGTSEMFMVANRSVGIGLTASAVFSSWMWINETVFSAAMCYRFGLAVLLWWATGLCFQIALMAALGVLAKIRVPYAHTSLEIIKMRYGRVGHVVFIVLNLVNNVFGCASMILTGSQLIYGISGMHFVAATILIPLGVVLYTAVGGLKATFLTDYLHTTVALILIMYFTLSILAHEAIGGLGGLYDKVAAVAAENYFGNLALVVMDTAFWQKSFDSEVGATVPGYDLAAVAIFGIPWGLGTVIGLAARAIHDTPAFPGYPAPFTSAEVNAGLVMPYTVKALTSTVSSSMIAVSSILSFDVYKTYVNPKADDRRLLKVSHLAVVAHAVFITGVSLALNYGGADMTWIGYMRPIIACPDIIPLGLTLCWSGQTRPAAILSPILGFLTGLGIWLGTAHALHGSVSLTTTEASLPALYGACGSMFSPAVYSVLISRYRPYEFDWREFLRIELADEYQINPDESSEESSISDEKKNHGMSKDDDEKHPTPPEPIYLSHEAPPSPSPEEVTAAPTPHKPKPRIPLSEIQHPFPASTPLELKRRYRLAWVFFASVVLATFVAWPMPLYRDYVFTRPFFSGWTAVAVAWQFFSFLAVAVYPLHDGRREIAKGARGVWRAAAGDRGADFKTKVLISI
ncbi:hypothetical protein F4781DRAFT_439973 [Annulohypoxylon bovei var. microspora]|nr:hypothetical protein F4781DRAFT_439973 [Annulohypoxylon bovei var. microspora]